jgi:hypothetical protein
MDVFEAFLEKATQKGTDGVSGAAVAVIDKNGMLPALSTNIAVVDGRRNS